MPTFDDLKHQFNGRIERRWGSAFEFACSTVVKRRCRIKNQEFDFVTKNGPQCQCGPFARKKPLRVDRHQIIFTRKFFLNLVLSQLSKTPEKMITLQMDQKINSDFNLPALKLATTLPVPVVMPVFACDLRRRSYAEHVFALMTHTTDWVIITGSHLQVFARRGGARPRPSHRIGSALLSPAKKEPAEI